MSFLERIKIKFSSLLSGLLPRKFWIVLLVYLVILLSVKISFPVIAANTNQTQESIEMAQMKELSQRQIACSQLSYADSSINKIDKKKSLYELPLNELLIELHSPHFVDIPNPRGVVPVEIGLYVNAVTNLDASTNTFEMEGFLDLAWCDPRLAFNPREIGVEEEIFLEKEAQVKLEKIWWPDITLVNEHHARDIENEELIIRYDGTVDYQERFAALLASNFEMRRFPFDTQKLLVEIESFAWSNDQLEFLIEEEVVGFSDEFHIPEWSIVEVTEHLATKQEIRDRAPFSEFIAEIMVKRDPGFYIMKIMIPLATIVALSWSVFWMIGDSLADRMSVSFTGVLTVVAYQFIVSDNLPKHVYNDFLDSMVLASFIALTLTIVENIIVHNFCRQKNIKLAAQVDISCQKVFPIFYLGCLSSLAIIYLL